MAVTPSRAVALEILSATRRGRRLDLAFSSAVRGLEARERRWIHEVVYGVSRLRGRLDHLLASHLHAGLEGVHPAVLDALRLGAYQLLHMASVPPYAAVSQTVDLARSVGRGGAGSVANAVLRRLAEEGEDPALFPDPKVDAAGYLSTWGSHPRWLVERWLSRSAFEDVRRLVELGNQEPPLTVVPLEMSPEQAVQYLRRQGIEARPAGWGSAALEVTDRTTPSTVLGHLAAVVQDPGAALVGVYADPPEGGLLADLCAAPGGKTLALSRGASYVLAADRSLPRLRLLRGNLVRTGVSAGLVQALAESPPIREASFVLLDVPCTGTGTFRRHPDARWRLSPGDPTRMAEVQRRMLRGASAVVPSGGVLVYSTCTLEPEENRDQVDRFLAENPDFELEDTGAVESALCEGGCLTVLPQRTGFDGAFAARLRRKG